MGILDIFKSKKIQAQEGAISNVILESLLTGTPLNTAGTERDYLNYASQTQSLYKKYNGKDQLGNPQCRSIIDTRTAFISGEGLSVICKNDDTAKFIDDFMKYNKFHGSRLSNCVKQGEFEGRVLQYLKPNKKDQMIKAFRIVSSYWGGKTYEVVYKDRNDPDSIENVLLKDGQGNVESLKERFVYTVTGGDGSNWNETSTRAGLCLWEMETFSRAQNAIRKNNHLFGKITPHFSSENAQDVSDFKTQAQSKQWKIGDVTASQKGNLEMVVPGMGAIENLKDEQIVSSKVISGVTGIPVHWFGYVDLMSNRSTAESLYETINNATIVDRVVWEESFYEMFIKAQEMAIDNGFGDIQTVDRDFEVKIPLIGFHKMHERVQALSLAYSDNAISIQDYRNRLPGINPYATEQMVGEEPIEKEALIELKTEGTNNGKENTEKE